ncbi:MAG: glycosyltransferase [Planctomycetota bacterium]
MGRSIDILMITYNRPEYTRLALRQLLDTCDESMRVWIWHNGTHEETLSLVRELSQHPAVHEFHHSPENRRLREPTNWLWERAAGDYICKVDDDCLLPHGWADTLRKAHEDVPEFGVLGCWRFLDEDFLPDVATRKIQTFAGGHQVMRNCWVEGSGYLMKRACLERCGPLGPKETFTSYCVRVAQHGWINGWIFPFIYQEHMDDPRTPHTMLKSDADLERWLPLSARANGVTTVAEWQEQLRNSARRLQHAPVDPKYYTGWRRARKALQKRILKLLGRNPKSYG